MGTALADIARAYWLGPASGCVLLTRDWHEEDPPDLALSSPDLQVKHIRLATPEFSGRCFGYYREAGSRIVFCQEAHRHPQVDFERTPVIVAGPFNEWGVKAPLETWQLRPRRTADGETLWECGVPIDRLAVGSEGTVFKFVTFEWHWLKVLSRAPNRTLDAAGNENYSLEPERLGRDVFLFDVAGGRGLDECHTIRLNGGGRSKTYPIEPGLFFYDLATHHRLGASVEKRTDCVQFPGFRRQCTLFRVFAPRARSCAVEVSESPRSERVRRLEMRLLDDGVTWEARVNHNLHGWFYHLRVDGPNTSTSTHFDPEMRILDPWALATAGAQGPGIVIDRSRLPHRSRHARFKPPQWQDLVILEAHIRDLAAQAPSRIREEDRLGFRGLTRWIESQGSYLRTLGCNALELLPVSQADNLDRHEYHWGYMPANVFAPNAHYSRFPERASAIEEFAALVDACHHHGLAVILDVVYNHVGHPAFLVFIDKAYYFHLEEDGSLTNWSGCGNTLKASSAMSRRLIIDSLVYLLETYGVDGFRFDLAELLTTEVLREIETTLKGFKEDIILIAEPWSFRGNITWELRTTGFAFWNDGYREFVAEYVQGRGNAEGLRYYLKGSTDHLAAFPAQSVNYVESHDDRCWIDKITENPGHDGRHPTPNDIRRTHLMAAILMCSVGIPMLAEGMDFLRSKRGVSNTYLRGDLNALDYGQIELHRATHEYFRSWIALRHSTWGELFRLRETPGKDYLRLFAQEGRSSAAVLFNADGSRGARQVLLAVNPHLDAVTLDLPGIAAGGWRELADHAKFDMNGLSTGRLQAGKRRLRLEPLDCGLWVRAGLTRQGEKGVSP